MWREKWGGKGEGTAALRLLLICSSSGACLEGGERERGRGWKRRGGGGEKKKGEAIWD